MADEDSIQDEKMWLEIKEKRIKIQQTVKEMSCKTCAGKVPHL